jgi:hypothetical protein
MAATPDPSAGAQRTDAGPYAACVETPVRGSFVKLSGLILIAVFVAAVAVSGGCEATITTGGTTSFTNDEYGFSFKIVDRFEKGDSASFSQSTGAADFTVAFLDPKGTQAAGQSLDAFMVSVYVLQQEVTADLMPALKSELETALGKLAAADSSVTMQPLTETTVNGVPGWSADYTMNVNDAPVQARTYFLVKGKNEYQITIQSSTQDWSKNEPDLQKAVDSFTVK